MERYQLNETAFLEYAPLEKNFDGQKKPVLLILPGGSYLWHADHEAYPVADAARAAGMHACILRYTVMTQRFCSLDDLLDETAGALDFLASRAEDDRLDMSRVTVLGFSAGGHLAAAASHRLSERLRRAVLCYPAVRMDFSEQLALPEEEAQRRADEEGVSLHVLHKIIELFSEWPERFIGNGSVPTFLFHSYDDPICPVQGILDYYGALVRAGIPSALHVFTTGGHGKSLATDVTRLDAEEEPCFELAAWWPLLTEWLELDL